MKKIFRKNWLVILILLLALFLRLYKISAYMEFLGDQGRDVMVVYQFLKHGDLMFIGPQTSIGNMYLGPWYYYLIAPSLLLSFFNPVGPAVMVALLGVVTVWFIWKIGREWFDPATAGLAALFFAISPVIVYYSNFSWNPNIMPLFALLSMWLLWRIWRKNEFKKLPWLGFSLAMVLNSHYLGLLLFPVGVLFLLIKFWQLKDDQNSLKIFLKFVIWKLVIFTLLMSPLLLFDLKHNFVNFDAFKQFFAVRQTTVNLKVYKGLLKFPQITNQLFANILLKKDQWPAANWLFLVLVLGMLKLRKKISSWFVFGWLLVGILGLTNYKQHVYAHYFGFLWPAAILFLAASLRKLWPFSLPILVYLACLMLLNWHGRQKPNYHLRRAQEVSNFILDKSEGREFALALIAEQNYDPPYRYFLQLKGAPLVDLHKKIVNQLFVICEPWGKVNCHPLGHPQWEVAAFGWAKIDQEWEREGVKIYKLVHQR